MIKFLLRTFIGIIVIALIWYFFGSMIYRVSVSYEIIGDARQYPVKTDTLKKLINSNAEEKYASARDVVKDMLSLCSDKLEFTYLYCDVDPNELIKTEKTNCIGYAAFVAAASNYIFEKDSSFATWRAKPQKGLVFLFGKNMHDWFSSPFFRDHDFVVIENSVTGEKFYTDPSVHDYLGVDFVKVKE